MIYIAISCLLLVIFCCVFFCFVYYVLKDILEGVNNIHRDYLNLPTEQIVELGLKSKIQEFHFRSYAFFITTIFNGRRAFLYEIGLIKQYCLKLGILSNS